MSAQLSDVSISNQSLAASIGKNTLFGVIASLVQMGTRFITVPIVIGYLGLDGYGIWSIIMTLAVYMRFGSAGVKSAFQKYVAEATGTGDYARANELLSTGSAGMLLLSLGGLIPIASYSSDLVRLMGVPDTYMPSTANAITLLAVIMVLSNVGAVYESVVMGGHRIDLARKLNAFFAILEAIAIVVVLYAGYGLVAMTGIMAVSEIAYLFCCYTIARRILPAIRITSKFISRDVWKELVTYAGGYQLVGMLELTYAVILPVAVLKFFGAVAAGEYALAHRLVMVSLLVSEAVLSPLLSSGSMIYASGSVEEIRQLLLMAFKITFALAVLPLTFIANFGTLIIAVWTGISAPALDHMLWLLCLAGLFRAMSLLQLVLYRVSGKSVMDNVRQVLRIVVVGVICIFGPFLGLLGVMGGLAIAEFAGLLFMFYALAQVYKGFKVRMIVSDTIKLSGSTLIIMAISLVVVNVPLPWMEPGRTLSALKLAIVVVTVAAVAWPAIKLTGALTPYELRTMMQLR